jgi:hypothetical protein
MYADLRRDVNSILNALGNGYDVKKSEYDEEDNTFKVLLHNGSVIHLEISVYVPCEFFAE